MPPFLLRDSILGKRLPIVAVLLALSCALAPRGRAQHPVVHTGGGGHLPPPGHVPPPRVFAPPIFRPPATTAPPVSEFGTRGSGFGPRPIFFPRHHTFFFAEPYYFGAFFWLESYWWMNCGSFWTWEFSGCYGTPTYQLAYENPPQPIETRVYVYSGEPHQQVQLFLKDGRVYSATDYWFVNGEVHFSMIAELEDGARRSVEHVIGFDELDVQKTVDVNTARGFRLVMRDQPWQQYLRDHPDANPPALVAPQKD